MNPLQIKDELLNPTAQIIVFNQEGKLLYSCNTLFNIRKKDSVSLFNAFPVLEGLQEVFFNLAEGERLNLPCVWFNYLGVSGHFDFLFIKQENKLYWLIQNFDKIYSKLISVQQERNVSIIDNEILEIHKKTQKKLSKVEQAYQYLFNNTPDLIQSIDTQGNIVFTNPAWQNTLQYTEQELAQLNFYDIVHPADLVNCKQIHQNILTKKKLKFIEFRLLTKNGIPVYVRGTINVLVADNESVTIQGIYRNITGKKLVEQKLKQSEALYRVLVENASDIIIKINTKGTITYMNKVGLKFVNKSEKELEGIDFTNWIDAHFKTSVKAFYANQFNSKQKSTYLEFPIIINKKKIWIGQNANLLCEIINGQERVNGFLLILRDISKQKKQEDVLNKVNTLLDVKVKERTEALNKSNQKLKHLNIELEGNSNELLKHIRELEEFSFIVSHNVRGPVARLLGLTMLFGKIDETEYNSLAKQIEAETISLDSIINDLKNILQIRNNIYQTYEQVNIKDVIQRVIKQLSDSTESPNTVNKVEINIEDIYVYGIIVYIQSILYNLISNALKYKMEGRALKVVVTCKVVNQNYLIEITDNGRGIDLKKFQNKLFRMYSRFDMDIQGKGVGLYLVKKQVEAMNGEIKVSSEVNKGTTFSILLPIPTEKTA